MQHTKTLLVVGTGSMDIATCLNHDLHKLGFWWILGPVYPLVNIQKAMEHGPVEIVDFPINSMVIFHGKMLVHQRVPKNDDGSFLDISTLNYTPKLETWFKQLTLGI